MSRSSASGCAAPSPTLHHPAMTDASPERGREEDIRLSRGLLLTSALAGSKLARDSTATSEDSVASSMWVSITTTDLARATAFYTGLGFTINPAFTDDNAACVELDDNLYLMVVTRDFFSTMTEKTIVDPRTHVQAGINITRDSRDDVDAIVTKGLAAGGTEPQPAQDYGFMYSRDLEDPDGNNIGFLYMDPAAAEKGPQAYLADQSVDPSGAA